MCYVSQASCCSSCCTGHVEHDKYRNTNMCFGHVVCTSLISAVKESGVGQSSTAALKSRTSDWASASSASVRTTDTMSWTASALGNQPFLCRSIGSKVENLCHSVAPASRVQHPPGFIVLSDCWRLHETGQCSAILAEIWGVGSCCCVKSPAQRQQIRGGCCCRCKVAHMQQDSMSALDLTHRASPPPGCPCPAA